MAAKAPPDAEQRIVSLALDAAFYRTVYSRDPEAARDPLAHYMRRGWREGRDPAPWFSTRRYLEAYPEIEKAGVDPFVHYLRDGRREGRDVFPSEHAGAYFGPTLGAGEEPAWSVEALLERGATALSGAWAISGAEGEQDRALAASEFDPAFYLEANPDVEADGVDPLDHFLEHGWREGRDPNPRFSVKDYLELYPEIAEAGINPFLHYLKIGRDEGRKPRQDLGFRYDILAGLEPLESRLAAAARASARVRPQGAAVLDAALARSRSGGKRLHVTFSHDDYTANLGGVQLCLRREAAAFADIGFDHLHLFPATAWPLVRAGEAAPLGAVWNGQPLGAFRASAIAKVLRDTVGRAPPERRTFAIHSLLGHAVDEVLAILAAFGQSRGFFWLHDFASVCAGYHLMRDDVQDCGAPPQDSAACGICVYGPWRGRHLAEFGRLFERLRLTVVSPAQPTLDFWRAVCRVPVERALVHPHAALTAARPAAGAGKRPFRLAFPGMPVAHKGWPVFRELALRFEHDPRYEFTHLGGRPVRAPPMTFQPVRATAEAPLAMMAALAECEADAALIWPLCRETFSFTAHEAVASGAAVITNPDSGNVAAFVAGGAPGRVLADEAALFAAFETGEIRKLSRAARKAQLYDLSFSRMTGDLIEAEAET